MRIANYDPTLNLINCFIEPGDKFYITVDGKRQETQTVTEQHILKPDSNPETLTPCFTLNGTKLFIVEAFNFTLSQLTLPVHQLIGLSVSPKGNISVDSPITNRVSIYVEVPSKFKPKIAGAYFEHLEPEALGNIAIIKHKKVDD